MTEQEQAAFDALKTQIKADQQAAFDALRAQVKAHEAVLAEARTILRDALTVAERPACEIAAALAASELHRRAAWLEKQALRKQLEARGE